MKVAAKQPAKTAKPRKARDTSAAGPIRALMPRTPDTKYTGDEPTWAQQPVEHRAAVISRSLYWYNYHYGKKEARDLLIQYLTHNDRGDDARTMRSVPDSAMQLTPAWVARMNLMGLELLPSEAEYLEARIQELLAATVITTPAAAAEAVTAPKPNIQDRLREKLVECAGELEGMYDDFRVNGCKLGAQFRPIEMLRARNVAPQMVNDIAEVWRGHLAELEAVLKGTDAQLVEGFQHHNKISIKNMIKFCESVINDCGSYVQIKKVERKPRKKKPVLPEKVAAKFKYQREVPEFKLKSEAAVKLVNCSEAWLYESKKRKLIHVVADEHVGTFTLKNNSIIGFDTVQTLQKTLRKPAEQLRALMAASKPGTRKVFKDIKATETKFNGRGTEQLVILKAW
jgi:hypothetical protein